MPWSSSFSSSRRRSSRASAKPACTSTNRRVYIGPDLGEPAAGHCAPIGDIVDVARRQPAPVAVDDRKHADGQLVRMADWLNTPVIEEFSRRYVESNLEATNGRRNDA